MDSIGEYFWGLLGYSRSHPNPAEDTESEIELECEAFGPNTMLQKQHLLRRRSTSKRFIIGDEGEDDTNSIPDIEVTAASDQPVMENLSSPNLLKPVPATLT